MADGVYALQFVVPIPPWSLLPDGERRIIDASVLEELLFAFLHLHDEMFALLVLAVHIEHGTPVVLLRAEVFGVQVGDVLYLFPSVQQGVEEADEQFLVYFRTEQLLECEVGIKVDVSFYDSFRAHKRMVLSDMQRYGFYS